MVYDQCQHFRARPQCQGVCGAQLGSLSSAPQTGVVLCGCPDTPWAAESWWAPAAAADGDRCWWDDGAGRSCCLWDLLGAGLAGSTRNPTAPTPGSPRVPRAHTASASNPWEDTVLGWAPGELLLNFTEREAPGAPGEPSAAPAERRWQPRLRGSGHGAYRNGSARCPHSQGLPGLCCCRPRAGAASKEKAMEAAMVWQFWVPLGNLWCAWSSGLCGS